MADREQAIKAGKYTPACEQKKTKRNRENATVLLDCVTVQSHFDISHLYPERLQRHLTGLFHRELLLLNTNSISSTLSIFCNLINPVL